MESVEVDSSSAKSSKDILTRIAACQSLTRCRFFSLFWSTQNLCLFVSEFFTPTLMQGNAFTFHENCLMIFVFQSKPLTKLSGHSKRPRGLLDVPDDIWEGYMASAGKASANIGIIKSDLCAIIAVWQWRGDTRKQVVYMTEDQYSHWGDKIDSKWKTNSWRIGIGRQEKGRENKLNLQETTQQRECEDVFRTHSWHDDENWLRGGKREMTVTVD